MRGDLVRAWLGFTALALVVIAAGYAALLAASFGGGHDSVGRMSYAAGAVVGTTGAFALTGRLASTRPIRLAATVMTVLTGLLWLIELPGFLSSPGWQF